MNRAEQDAPEGTYSALQNLLDRTTHLAIVNDPTHSWVFIQHIHSMGRYPERIIISATSTAISDLHSGIVSVDTHNQIFGAKRVSSVESESPRQVLTGILKGVGKLLDIEGTTIINLNDITRKG